MKRSTFTLVELLGVMAIIAILAALGFAGYSYASTKSKESATEALLTRINAAFEMAQKKSGFLPPADGYKKIIINHDDKKIKIGTVLYPKSDSSGRELKMYNDFYKSFIQTLQMDSMERFLNDDKEIIDAWGNPIYYCYPGKLKTGGFDLISAGSDGLFGSDNDDEPTDSTTYRANGEWICDDIANF